MKKDATPHLIWALTILIIFGVIAFFAKGAIEKSGERADKIIDAVVKSMEEGHIKISVDLGVESEDSPHSHSEGN